MATGRLAKFESKQVRLSRIAKNAKAQGLEFVEPGSVRPEPTPRMLAAQAREAELDRKRFEIKQEYVQQYEELRARKEALHIELDEVNAGIEMLVILSSS